MKVSFKLRDDDVLWTYPIQTTEFERALNNQGVIVTDECPDVTIQDYYFGAPSGPTIIFDRHDASAITPEGTKYDSSPDVLGYLIPIKATGQSITDQVWGKAETKKPVRAFTTLLWHQMPYYDVESLDLTKQWDVWFAGTTSGHGHEHTRLHRMTLQQEWCQLAKFSSNALFIGGWPRPLSGHQSLQLSAKAKVVISPWGNNELSWRDYEAVLGCSMIVKPVQGRFEVTANPWFSDNVVYCSRDFRDLADAVAIALEAWDMGALRGRRREIITTGSNLNLLAQEFKNVVRSIVE